MASSGSQLEAATAAGAEGCGRGWARHTRESAVVIGTDLGFRMDRCIAGRTGSGWTMGTGCTRGCSVHAVLRRAVKDE
jgi:hypothetical protein